MKKRNNIITEKKTSIILTRSKELNEEMINEINTANQGNNYEFIECDLIEYELEIFDMSILDKFKNIIITSYYASLNMPKNNSHDIYVVGKKSAQILKEKGYNIKCCAKNVEELKNSLPQNIYNSTIYLSGNNITTNMPDDIEHKIFYKTYYREFLLKKQTERFKKGIDYILLYSSNCAKTLIKLLINNDLLNYLENTTVIAISANVKKIVEEYFKDIQICKNNNLMIDCLQKHERTKQTN